MSAVIIISKNTTRAPERALKPIFPNPVRGSRRDESSGSVA